MRSAKESGRRSWVTYRNGHDGFPGWGGMSLRSDPGSVPLNMFRHIENGRPVGGNWKRRAGQEALNTTTVHSSDAWFRAITDVLADPFRLYIAAGGCVTSTTVGFSIVWFDIDQEPRLQSGTWYETIEDIRIGAFDGDLYLGLSDTAPSRKAEFRRYQVIPQGWGTNAKDRAGLKQEYPLYTITGWSILWMEACDDKLFLSLDHGATGGGADNRIAAYDGLSMYDGSTLAMGADRSARDYPATVMARHREFLVAGYSEAANMISVRVSGAVPGTWHDITPAAGTIRSRRMEAYRNILYIVPGGAAAEAENIWQYNDADPATFLAASLTVAHNIANASITCLAVHNGYLYYGWRDTVGGGISIGRFDGTTWTDNHKRLDTQGADSRSDPSDIIRIDELKSYRGSLYAVVFCPVQIAPDPLIDEGSYLIYSNGNDTSGTWQINNLSASANDRRLPVTLTTGGIVKAAVVM